MNLTKASTSNPSEAVAYGVAFQAAVLSDGTSEKTQGLILMFFDAAPRPFGTYTTGGVMTTLGEWNTTALCTGTVL